MVWSKYPLQALRGCPSIYGSDRQEMSGARGRAESIFCDGLRPRSDLHDRLFLSRLPACSRDLSSTLWGTKSAHELASRPLQARRRIAECMRDPLRCQPCSRSIVPRAQLGRKALLAASSAARKPFGFCIAALLSKYPREVAERGTHVRVVRTQRLYPDRE